MSRRIDWDKTNKQKRVRNGPSQTPPGPSIVGKAPCMPYSPDLPMTGAQREWYERSKLSYYERKKIARDTAAQTEKQELLRPEVTLLERLRKKYPLK